MKKMSKKSDLSSPSSPQESRRTWKPCLPRGSGSAQFQGRRIISSMNPHQSTWHCSVLAPAGRACISDEIWLLGLSLTSEYAIFDRWKRSNAGEAKRKMAWYLVYQWSTREDVLFSFQPIVQYGDL